MMRHFYFLLLLMLLISCKKEKVQPEPTSPNQTSVTPISTSLLPLLFDTSSQWIYTNGISFDTITLISVIREETFVSQNTPNAETFDLSYESSQFNNYSEKLMGAIITRGWIDAGWAYATNLSVGQSQGGLTYTQHLDTLTVGSQEFYDVSKMKVLQGNYFSNDMYLYYSDSVGVIRKEVLSGATVIETWDLTQSSILMYDY